MDLSIYQAFDIVIWLKPEYLNRVLQLSPFYEYFIEGNPDWFWKEYFQRYYQKEEGNVYRGNQLRYLFKLYHKSLHVGLAYVSFIQVTSLDFTNKHIGEIPKEIGQMTQLQCFYMDRSKICEIPTEIGLLTQLRILCLCNNYIARIPKEICLLTQLQELYLHHNDIAEIPTEICQLTQLRKLDLCNNRTGDIPKEIDQLTRLRFLCLSQNAFDEIPAGIGKLTQPLELYINGISQN